MGGWAGKFWQCNECLKCSRSVAKPPPGRCTQKLKVSPQSLRDLGHRCIIVDCSDGSFVAFCQLCFFYTCGGQLRGLGAPCPARPSPQVARGQVDKLWSAHK